MKKDKKIISLSKIMEKVEYDCDFRGDLNMFFLPVIQKLEENTRNNIYAKEKNIFSFFLPIGLTMFQYKHSLQ